MVLTWPPARRRNPARRFEACAHQWSVASVDTQYRPLIDSAQPAISWVRSTETLTATKSPCSSVARGNVRHEHTRASHGARGAGLVAAAD